MSSIIEKQYFTKNPRKYLGVNWYKNIGCTKETETKYKAQYHCLVNKKKKEQVVARKKGYDYLWAIVNLEEIENLIKTDNNIFEILPEDGKRKIYFDIDAKDLMKKGTFEEHLNKCKDIIKSFFIDAELQISGSESEKYSYHIILSNYFARTQKDMYRIKNFCEFYSDYGFDVSVYKNNNQFKCINQSKGLKKQTIITTNEETGEEIKKQININDTRIQKYISGSTDNTKHLVMWDFDKNAINIDTLNFDNFIIIGKNINLSAPQKREKLELKKQGIDISKLQVSDISLPFEFDYANASPLEKLEVLPNYKKGSGKELHHNIQMNVMWWCKNRCLVFEDFWKWCSKKDSNIDREYNYLQSWERSHYIVNVKTVDILLEQFYPKLKENYNFHRYEQLCDTSKYITKMLEENEYLSVSDISDKKIQVFAVGCGKSKTGTAIDYIKRNINKKVVIIVPRISLAYDFQGRLSSEGIKIANYKEIKNIEQLSTKEKIIISAESLYKLQLHRYDIVIIDEFETLINTFSTDNTHKKFILQNWRKMIQLIKQSEKTFIMDAITTLKTVNFIKYIGYSDDFSLVNNIRVKERELQFMAKKGKMFDIEYEKMFFSMIIDSLKKGEKCFVFMPYKEGRKETHKDIHCIRGVLPLMNYICQKLGFEKGKDIEGYYSEAFEEKRDLKDVNNVWRNMKCIITNTCSSVGINYNLKDFDKVYIYYAGWVNPRDLIQATKRPRTIKDIKMIIYEEKNVSGLVEKNTIPWITCEIYRKMMNLIMIERNCFCKEALFHLCKNNGIEVLTNKIEVDYEVSKELIKFEESDNFVITYDSIDDLGMAELAYLQKLKELGEITLYQKYQLEKYFFKLDNNYNEPSDEVLRGMWRDRYYIEKFDILLKDENHSINQLLNYHKTPIFDVGFKFKEDGYIPIYFELKQFGFINEFKFKKIEKNLSQSTYMKILNGFFGEFTLKYCYGFDKKIITKRNEKGKLYNKLHTQDGFTIVLPLYIKHNRRYIKSTRVYTKKMIKEDIECLLE